MRILITGGAGFIGSNFVKSLLRNKDYSDFKITVIDKLTYAGTLSNFDSEDIEKFEFVKGDICDREFMEKILKRVDIIVNFAAESHVDRSIYDSSSFVSTNIRGVHTLLELLRDSNKTLLQVSTDEVYGSISDGSWNEDFSLSPNSPYSASKASADLLCQAFYRTYGIDVRITRCSNNYGPNQFPEKVIPLFITNLMRSKKIPLYGSGSNVRDWLHVDDHCRGIDLVLKNGLPGEIYNIGGGTELTNISLAKIILNEFGLSEDWITFVDDRKGHDFRYSVNIEKIKKIGYRTTVDFSKGIKSTIDWYKANESWWRTLIQ